MAKINVDLSSVKESGFDPIPTARYPVIISNSEMCQTKKGDGSYLKLTFKVIDGEYTGRLIWLNLNLDNPSRQAEEIAQRELKSITTACDLDNIDDSEELHGIPITGQVKIKPEQGGYPASNTIGNFKAVTETAGSNATEEAPW